MTKSLSLGPIHKPGFGDDKHPSALLLRPLPAGYRDLLGAAERKLFRWRRARYRGTRTNRCSRTNPHRRDKIGARADEGIILDNGAMLVGAVIVASNRAGADVYVSA